MSEPDLPELDRWLYVGTTLIKVTPGSTGPDVFCKLLDAEAAIATERARADTLQAELDAEKETTANLVRALREATEGPTFMGEPVLPPIYARADALEAALRELVAVIDSPRFKTSVSSRFLAAMKVARALLEKKT